MTHKHIRLSLFKQAELLKQLKSILFKRVGNNLPYDSFSDECCSLLDTIDKEYHWTITSFQNTLNQIASAVDHVGEQLEHQMAHANKLQTYIAMQTPSHFGRTNEEFESFMNHMNKEQKSLQKDIKKLIKWRDTMSIHPIGGDIEHVMKQQKELKICQRKNRLLVFEKESFEKQMNKLKDKLKQMNEKCSIYKDKLQIIKQLKTKNKVKIITDQNQKRELMEIEYGKMKNELSQKNAEIDKLSSKLKEKCDFNQIAVDSMQRKVENAELRLIEVKWEEKDLKSQIVELNKTNKELMEQNHQKVTNLEESNDYLEQIESLKNKHENEMCEYKEKCRIVMENYDKLKAHSDGNDQKIESLKEEKNEIFVSCNQIETEYKEKIKRMQMEMEQQLHNEKMYKKSICELQSIQNDYNVTLQQMNDRANKRPTENKDAGKEISNRNGDAENDNPSACLP